MVGPYRGVGSVISRPLVNPDSLETYQPGPSVGEAFGAASRLENTIGSLANKRFDLGRIARRWTGYVDPGFDPFETIIDSRYEPWVDRFSSAINQEEVELIKLELDQELRDKRTLAMSGSTGFAAALMAGTVDPINLIPVGSQVIKGAQAATRLGRIGKGALLTARAGAIGVGLQEAALQQTQETRSLQEVMMNIGGGTLLAGILGGAAGAFTPGEFHQAARQLNQEHTNPITIQSELDTIYVDKEGIATVGELPPKQPVFYTDETGNVYVGKELFYPPTVSSIKGEQTRMVFHAIESEKRKPIQAPTYPLAVRKVQSGGLSGNRAAAAFDQAFDLGVISNEVRQLGSYFATQVDSKLDANTIFEFVDSVGYATREELKRAGYDPRTTNPRILGKTESIKTQKGDLQTSIKLYQGADANTLVEEWYHRGFDRLTPVEKQAVQQYWKEIGADKKIAVHEFFAKQGTGWFFSQRLHEKASTGILSIFTKLRERLMDLITRIRRIRGAKIPDKIEAMYRAIGTPHEERWIAAKAAQDAAAMKPGRFRAPAKAFSGTGKLQGTLLGYLVEHPLELRRFSALGDFIKWAKDAEYRQGGKKPHVSQWLQEYNLPPSIVRQDGSKALDELAEEIQSEFHIWPEGSNYSDMLIQDLQDPQRRYRGLTDEARQFSEEQLSTGDAYYKRVFYEDVRPLAETELIIAEASVQKAMNGIMELHSRGLISDLEKTASLDILTEIKIEGNAEKIVKERINEIEQGGKLTGAAEEIRRRRVQRELSDLLRSQIDTGTKGQEIAANVERQKVYDKIIDDSLKKLNEDLQSGKIDLDHYILEETLIKESHVKIIKELEKDKGQLSPDQIEDLKERLAIVESELMTTLAESYAPVDPVVGFQLADSPVTMEDLVNRVTEIENSINDFIDKNGEIPIRITLPHTDVLIHKSAKSPTKWQATFFNSQGEPISDIQRQSFKEIVEEISIENDIDKNQFKPFKTGFQLAEDTPYDQRLKSWFQQFYNAATRKPDNVTGESIAFPEGTPAWVQKILSVPHPSLRVMTIETMETPRKIMEDLASLPELQVKNFNGIGTNENASDIIEKNLTIYKNRVKDAINDGYMKRLKRLGRIKDKETQLGKIKLLKEQIFHAQDIQTFKDQINDAMLEMTEKNRWMPNTGLDKKKYDPEILEVVNVISTQMNELGKRAQRARIIEKNLPLEEGYVHWFRVWNQEAIRNHPEQARKAILQEQMEFEAIKNLMGNPEKGETKPANPDEIIDTILNSPAGYLAPTIERSSDPTAIDKATHLQSRSIQVDSSKMKVPRLDANGRPVTKADGTIEYINFVETDPEAIFTIGIQSLIPDIVLSEKFGDITMEKQFKELLKEYETKKENLRTNNAPEKEFQRLKKDRDSALEGIKDVRDLLRNDFRKNEGRWFNKTDGLPYRWSSAVLSINAMTMLGGVLASSIPDLARPLFHYGMEYYVPGIQNYLKYMDSPEGKEWLKESYHIWGVVGSLTSDSHLNRFSELNENYRPGSKIERGIKSAADQMGTVTGIEWWNRNLKTMTAFVASHAVLDVAKKIQAGQVVKESFLAHLAGMGLGRKELLEIADEAFTKNHSEIYDGLILAHVDRWNNKKLASQFTTALHKEVNNIIITPNAGDKPLWFQYQIGKHVSQFMGYPMKAMRAIVIRGMQTPNTELMQGIFGSMVLGGFTYTVKQFEKFDTPTSDPRQFIYESLDRAGLMGYLSNMNSMMNRLTGWSPTNMVGLTETSKFRPRSWADIVLGPTASTVQDYNKALFSAVPHLATGNLTEGDIGAVHRLIWYHRMFGIRQALEGLRALSVEHLAVAQ